MNADCPIVLPSWPINRWPSQSNRIHPRPQCDPSVNLSGTSICGSVMAAADASDRTRAPSAATPWSRCIRANDRRSPTVPLMMPAGPMARGRCHTGASVCGSPGSPTCPNAVRNRSASSGSVTVCVFPSLSNSRSFIAASHTFSVSTSMTRPART